MFQRETRQALFTTGMVDPRAGIFLSPLNTNDRFYLSRCMTKPTKWPVHQETTQVSLGILPVWPEPSLCALRIAKDLRLLHADSEDSDQTGRMPRLVWVFAGRIVHFVGFVMLQLNDLFPLTLPDML